MKLNRRIIARVQAAARDLHTLAKEVDEIAIYVEKKGHQARADLGFRMLAQEERLLEAQHLVLAAGLALRQISGDITDRKDAQGADRDGIVDRRTGRRT